MYNVKLLIVEDDIVIRGIYHTVLKKTISTIILARNGEEGYELFKKEQPDLILTDIKMPVMNGLDMITKIRNENKTVRILIMSAYGESKYFINAIESGVKGFLTKPFRNDHLEKVVGEQANDILLEKKFKDEEKKRIAAELSREKSDKIINSLSTITTAFLQQGLNESSIMLGLKLIGESTMSSRIAFYKLVEEDKQKAIIQQNIWHSNASLEASIENSISKLLLNTPMLIKWLNILEANGYISGNVSEFDSTEKQVFENINSKSVIAIPIFVNEDLWGCISLDDVFKERKWNRNEISALYSFAYNLGAAVYRKNTEQELIHMNVNLEERVKERTKALEIEIAERSKTQDLLRESEEKYRLIYENAGEGILLIQDGKVILTNPTMVMLMDIIPRKLIGNNFHDFIRSDNKNEIEAFFNINEEIIKEESFEVMISTKSEKRKWLELKVSGIDWDGEPGYLVFASDVSTKKKAQYNLKQLNKSLEERIQKEINNVKQQQELLIQKTKLESLGELSAGLAHEINQPLGGISMGLENILIKMSQDELNNEYVTSKVNLLFEDIDRIKNIIEHVRTFSRDQQNTSIELLDVDNVVRNAISLINKQYRNHQIDLIIDIPKEVYKTYGNPFKLEQVLLNILSNAKAAVDRRLEINCDTNYHKQIKILLEKDHEVIYINVSDNGIGMTKEIMDKIFEPFFTTKDQQSGTGLGLSISYGIINKMNGMIRVESEENACTKLTIELPLIKP